MNEEYRLTTIDNPYDPFTQFKEWNDFDIEKGYYTLSFLGRVTQSSKNLSALDEELARIDAIDEIVKYNVLGIYKKVKKKKQKLINKT